MYNKTNLDLSKYDFSNLPKITKINNLNDYKVVTFNKIFSDVMIGNILTVIGDEFTDIYVVDVISENILVLETDVELSIGMYVLYKTDINPYENESGEYMFTAINTNNNELIRYLQDRTLELNPIYKDDEERYETTIHPGLIKYFSKFSMEEQEQLVKALEKADVLLEKGKTTIKNLDLNKIFNKTEWDNFFNDVFNKIKF